MLVAFLVGLLVGPWAINRLYRTATRQLGWIVLSGAARKTGDREVAVDIRWRWAAKNPRPGMADQIVVIASEDFERFVMARPPVNNAPECTVDFGSSCEAGSELNAIEQTGAVKASAAVAPNIDGDITVYLPTETDPDTIKTQFVVLYLMVDRYPSAAEGIGQYRRSLAETFVSALGGDLTRVEILHWPLRIDWNISHEQKWLPQVPGHIAAALPDQAGWAHYSVDSVKEAAFILGNPDVAANLEFAMRTTMPRYFAKWSLPTVLIRPDGQEATIVYTCSTKRHIVIPVTRDGDEWAVGEPREIVTK